jgi:hypothetical protein
MKNQSNDARSQKQTQLPYPIYLQQIDSRPLTEGEMAYHAAVMWDCLPEEDRIQMCGGLVRREQSNPPSPQPRSGELGDKVETFNQAAQAHSFALMEVARD